MQQSGDGTGNHPRDEGAQQRHPDIDPIGHQHDTYRAAGAHGSIHRQVGQIQDLKGDIDADGHEPPNQALGQGARQRIEQI